MPIQSYDPPAASLAALQAAAQTVMYQHVADMMQEIWLDPPQHWPHPVYCVGLNQAASASGPWKAELIGWRYLVHSRSERDYAIEVQVNEDGTQHQFAELDKGPYIDGIYRVLKNESLQQQLGATVFKLAVLCLHALGVVAVWLQTDEPEQALFIPLPPTSRCLAPEQPYTTNQFQDVLREKAKEKLAQTIQTPDIIRLRKRA